MKYDTDLGSDPKDYSSPISAQEPSRIYYPSVHLSGPEELDLPEEGTITFKYKLRREASSKDGDGKHRYDCDLDLTKLVSATPEKDERPSRRDTSTEDALDKLMKEREGDDGDDEDEDEDY